MGSYIKDLIDNKIVKVDGSEELNIDPEFQEVLNKIIKQIKTDS